MSVSNKIAKLEELIRAKPALADVPFIVVNGTPLSPRQALANLKAGISANAIMRQMQVAGFDPAGRNEYKLAEEYYRRLAAQPRPPIIASISIPGVTLPPGMTYQRALQEIMAHTAIGDQLVKAHLLLLNQIKTAVA